MHALIIAYPSELRSGLVSTVRELGFEVATPDTGPAALDAFRTHQHPLVIANWHASNWDGAAFCQSLRQIDSSHRSIVLVLAADNSPADELQSAIDAGADDYILCPIELPLLSIRLQVAARRVQTRSESARIEQQLRESNLRFDLAVRGANEGLWDAQLLGRHWNRPDTVVWYSPRFKELLGFSTDEFDQFPDVLDSWASRLHPDDRDSIFQAVGEHVDHKRPYDVEYRLRTKSGEYRWFSARGEGIWDEQGQLLRMAGSLRDITTFKQFEAKLQHSEATWRTLVENAPDIILLANLDGTIKFINRTTPIAVQSVGRTIYDYIEEPYKDAARAALEAVRSTGHSQRFEVRGLSENGQAGIWYANRLGPIRNNDRIESVILIATDITHRKIAEEHVRREQQLLRRLLDLQERERRLVAYDIHDGLVQYLTGALMHLEAFAAAAPATPDDAHVEYDRGIELLREALAEGRRLISGLRPPILDERGIVAALEYVVNEMRPYIPQIEFLNYAHFGRLVPAIEVAIFRIAQEALTNVRLHSGAQRAQVELLQHGEWVRLVIRDWGRGFDPAEVQEERFGLQGIRQRVGLLGASAVVDSAPGQGTVITVDFPLIPEKSLTPGEPLPTAQKSP